MGILHRTTLTLFRWPMINILWVEIGLERVKIRIICDCIYRHSVGIFSPLNKENTCNAKYKF